MTELLAFAEAIVAVAWIIMAVFVGFALLMIVAAIGRSIYRRLARIVRRRPQAKVLPMRKRADDYPRPRGAA